MCVWGRERDRTQAQKERERERKTTTFISPIDLFEEDRGVGELSGHQNNTRISIIFFAIKK